MKSDKWKDVDWSGLRQQMLGGLPAVQQFRASAGTAETVGYGKPPRSGQFKKGQSGNPNGRPKNTPPFDAVSADVLAVGRRKIKANRGDGAEDVSMSVALVEKIYESALKGNAMAQREMLRQLHIAEAAEAAQHEKTLAFWKAYQAEGWRRMENAKEAGKQEPVLIPHPDDMSIDDEMGVSFKGPRTLDEHVDCKLNVMCRDAFLLQDAVDRRMGAIPRYPSTKADLSYSFCKAIAIDKTLPKRLRLGSKITDRVKTLGQGTKRALLKAHRAAFAKLGIPVKRGSIMPTMQEAEPLEPIVTKHLAGITKNDTEEQIVKRLRRMLDEAGIEIRDQ